MSKDSKKENPSMDVDFNKDNEKQAKFSIEKIYAADLSFESKNPTAFLQANKEWKPEINVEVGSKANQFQVNEQTLYNVVLQCTVTARIKNQTVFIVEVKQGGVFNVQNADKERLGPILGSFCPNILFPYAREAIADMVGKGGFPQLSLSHINFDALYAQHLRRQNDNNANVDGQQNEAAGGTQH